MKTEGEAKIHIAFSLPMHTKEVQVSGRHSAETEGVLEVELGHRSPGAK